MNKLQIKKYIMTHDECKKKLNGVCTGCGRPVELMETVDNAGNSTWWGGCHHCSKLCWGVPIERYKVARALVCKHKEIYYSYLGGFPNDGSWRDKRHWLLANISGICGLIARVECEQQRQHARIANHAQNHGKTVPFQRCRRVEK